MKHTNWDYFVCDLKGHTSRVCKNNEGFNVVDSINNINYVNISSLHFVSNSLIMSMNVNGVLMNFEIYLKAMLPHHLKTNIFCSKFK